jgi:hypothetical protein
MSSVIVHSDLVVLARIGLGRSVSRGYGSAVHA